MKNRYGSVTKRVLSLKIKADFLGQHRTINAVQVFP